MPPFNALSIIIKWLSAGGKNRPVCQALPATLREAFRAAFLHSKRAALTGERRRRPFHLSSPTSGTAAKFVLARRDEPSSLLHALRAGPAPFADFANARILNPLKEQHHLSHLKCNRDLPHEGKTHEGRFKGPKKQLIICINIEQLGGLSQPSRGSRGQTQD